jgi:hypothetical protein
MAVVTTTGPGRLPMRPGRQWASGDGVVKDGDAGQAGLGAAGQGQQPVLAAGGQSGTGARDRYAAKHPARHEHEQRQAEQGGMPGEGVQRGARRQRARRQQHRQVAKQPAGPHDQQQPGCTIADSAPSVAASHR